MHRQFKIPNPNQGSMPYKSTGVFYDQVHLNLLSTSQITWLCTGLNRSVIALYTWTAENGFEPVRWTSVKYVS